jgi:ribosomal protein S18 acetylase RimI-like enzyme
MTAQPGKKQVHVHDRAATLTNALFGRTRGGIRLSIAEYEDVEALQRLEKRTFSEKRYDQMSEDAMRHMIRGGNGVLILAWEKDKLQGYALVLFKRNSVKARFGSLAVDPAAQGSGIGTILFAAAEQAALAARATVMLLEIRADNIRLKKSYLKKGYVIDREEEGYFPDGCACLKLSRALG